MALSSAPPGLCVPTSLSQDVGTALGNQAGAQRLQEVFAAAGLRGREVARTLLTLVIEGRR